MIRNGSETFVPVSQTGSDVRRPAWNIESKFYGECRSTVMMPLVCETKREITLSFGNKCASRWHFTLQLGVRGRKCQLRSPASNWARLHVGYYSNIVYNVPVMSKPHGQHSTIARNLLQSSWATGPDAGFSII